MSLNSKYPEQFRYFEKMINESKQILELIKKRLYELDPDMVLANQLGLFEGLITTFSKDDRIVFEDIKRKDVIRAGELLLKELNIQTRWDDGFLGFCHNIVECGPDEFYYIMKSEWDSASLYVKEMPYKSQVKATHYNFYDWLKENDLEYYFDADQMGLI